MEPLICGGEEVIMIIFSVIALAIVCQTISSILHTRSKERTRREVAAYVAEGSMTAEEGERLLRAGAGEAESEEEC